MILYHCVYKSNLEDLVMSNNKDLYNIIGGLAKSVVGEIIDKAVESSKNVSSFIDDEIKTKFDTKEDSTVKSGTVPSETDFMKLFIEQYDGEITPAWNRVELRFVDTSTNREFIAFKNGYLSNGA